jgi:hypothetical protein
MSARKIPRMFSMVTVSCSLLVVLAGCTTTEESLSISTSVETASARRSLNCALQALPVEFVVKGRKYEIREAWLEDCVSRVTVRAFGPVEATKGVYLCYVLKGLVQTIDSLPFPAQDFRIDCCEPPSLRIANRQGDYVVYQLVHDRQQNSWQGHFGGEHGVMVTFARKNVMGRETPDKEGGP